MVVVWVEYTVDVVNDAPPVTVAEKPRVPLEKSPVPDGFEPLEPVPEASPEAEAVAVASPPRPPKTRVEVGLVVQTGARAPTFTVTAAAGATSKAEKSMLETAAA